MNQGRKFIQSLTGDFSLDADLIPGIPIVEICDRTRVLIENHQGIACYGRNEIHIKVRFGEICVQGDNLKLKQMCRNKLIITGKIDKVNLQGRG